MVIRVLEVLADGTQRIVEREVADNYFDSGVVPTELELLRADVDYLLMMEEA